MQVVTFLPPPSFCKPFCSFLLLFITFKKFITYLDSGKAEKSLKQQNKLYLWEAQILWWVQNSESYCTTISLEFSDLWPYYRAIEITWNVQSIWQCLISNSINSGVLLCMGLAANKSLFPSLCLHFPNKCSSLRHLPLCASRCGTGACACLIC